MNFFQKMAKNTENMEDIETIKENQILFSKLINRLDTNKAILTKYLERYEQIDMKEKQSYIFDLNEKLKIITKKLNR